MAKHSFGNEINFTKLMYFLQDGEILVWSNTED